MSAYSNQAAWLMKKGQRLTVADAPVMAPGPHAILIRTRAIAINPFDGVVQTLGGMITPWVTYPAILGSDVAGEVVAVGSAVRRFRVGDRVLGLALGIDKLANSPAEGAFQHYVTLREEAASAIPDSLGFDQASVLPLAVATAACGLFLPDQLGLRPPSLASPTPVGQTVLVWGGSTSVGACAVQLAAAAGYDVITTASSKNFAFARGLGAGKMYDYRDREVIDQIVDELKDRELAGTLAISAGSGAACIEIAGRCSGPRRVSLASAPLPVDDAPLDHAFAWKISRIPRLAMGFLGLAVRARLRRVTTTSIWGTALVGKPLGRLIFGEYLEAALATGRFKAAPEPLIAGHSIRDIESAMARLRQGVSAQKVVVSLQ